MCTQVYSGTLRCTQVYSGTHSGTVRFTQMYSGVLKCTRVYSHTVIPYTRTQVYSSVLKCTQEGVLPTYAGRLTLPLHNRTLHRSRTRLHRFALTPLSHTDNFCPSSLRFRSGDQWQPMEPDAGGDRAQASERQWFACRRCFGSFRGNIVAAHEKDCLVCRRVSEVVAGAVLSLSRVVLVLGCMLGSGSSGPRQSSASSSECPTLCYNGCGLRAYEAHGGRCSAAARGQKKALIGGDFRSSRGQQGRACATTSKPCIPIAAFRVRVSQLSEIQSIQGN